MYVGISCNASDLDIEPHRSKIIEGGFTHAKIKASVTGSTDWYLERAEKFADLDMEMIPDIRMGGNAFMAATQQVSKLVVELKQKEPFKSMVAPEACEFAAKALEEKKGRKLDEDEKIEVARELAHLQLQAVMAEACKSPFRKMAENVYTIIEATKGLVHRFEFWGEFSCPVVTQGTFSNLDYSLAFGEIAKAAKEANPDIEVWCGGNGMNLALQWLRDLVAPTVMPGATLWYPDGLGDLMDVANLHHYYHTRWAPGQITDLGTVADEMLGLDCTIDAYDKAFREAKNILLMSRSQPLASSEWGYPTVLDADIEGRSMYSALYGGGVMGVLESVAAEWFDQSLACFDRWDFTIVCVHELRDTPDSKGMGAWHWGNFCGLHGSDWREKPQWKVVTDWAKRGRDLGKSKDWMEV